MVSPSPVGALSVRAFWSCGRGGTPTKRHRGRRRRLAPLLRRPRHRLPQQSNDTVDSRRTAALPSFCKNKLEAGSAKETLLFIFSVLSPSAEERRDRPTLTRPNDAPTQRGAHTGHSFLSRRWGIRDSGWFNLPALRCCCTRAGWPGSKRFKSSRQFRGFFKRF